MYFLSTTIFVAISYRVGYSAYFEVVIRVSRAYAHGSQAHKSCLKLQTTLWAIKHALSAVTLILNIGP